VRLSFSPWLAYVRSETECKHDWMRLKMQDWKMRDKWRGWIKTTGPGEKHPI